VCHIINLIAKKVLKITEVDIDDILNEIEDDDSWALTIENSDNLITIFINLI